MKKPLIAITMGDPAGIGPEIIVKALADEKVFSSALSVVLGERKILEKALKITGKDKELSLNIIADPGQARDEKGLINLLDFENVDKDTFEWGQVQAMCGQASFDYIAKSIDLAMQGKIDAVCTGPINKEAIKAADIDFIGHTEIFGQMTGSHDPLTMFETGSLRIFFLTRHLALREVPDYIKKERIIDYVKRCNLGLRTLGIEEGKMAVAGLNPHSGEHGLFGLEEVEEITPAVEELQKAGYSVEGPIGADSVFHLAATGKFNSVLSLYHDQGHIAAKTLDFDRTISVTLGMPVLRTSVDHGTAFDIAGKNIAREISMVEALLAAAKYAPAFKNRADTA